MRTLETARLLLRPLAPEERDAVYRVLVDEIEGEGFTPERYEPERQFDVFLQQQSLGVHFGRPSIFLRADGRYIGYCLLMPRLCTNAELGWAGTRAGGSASSSIEAEIGWAISDRHRGQGYATEAASAVVDYAFGELGLPRIVAFTDADNQASIRVMEKIGMRTSKLAGMDTVAGVGSRKGRAA